MRFTHHCGNDPHDEHWCRQPEDFGEVKKQCGDPTNPCHQGTDAHSLVPHCRWEQLGRIEVDNEERDGSTELAHERQNQLEKGYSYVWMVDLPCLHLQGLKPRILDSLQQATDDAGKARNHLDGSKGGLSPGRTRGWDDDPNSQ